MRFNKSIAPIAASVLLATVASAPVLANQAGDIIVRAGITSVDPDSNDSTIYATADNLTVHLDTQANGASAITASVENDSQLGLNLVYFFSEKVAVELLAATPFSHDISVNTGTSLGTINLGSTKHLPPTVSVLYYPNEPTSKWQPYLGLGVNYTVFFEEEFNPALTSATSPAIAGLNGADATVGAIELSDLKLKNSWGLSAQVGLDYHLDNNWLVNASARYIDIDTTGTFSAVGGAVSGKVDVDIDPWVYTLSIGYIF